MTTIDTRELTAGSEMETDLCLIGAGAAGISIACQLAGSAVRICLIEAGDRTYKRATQAQYAGYNVGLPSYPLTQSRYRVLGGSTTEWGGQCGALDPDDFVPRSWVPYSGWPFSLPTLQPYYERAQNFLGFGSDDSAWIASPDRPVLELGDSGLTSKMFRFCEETDFRTLHRQYIETANNITTYLNASAVEVEQTESGTAVSGVRIMTARGDCHRVRARAFVLATGGLENIRLLLASNRESGGIGNANGLVGRFFMDHPFLYSGAVDFANSAFEKNAHVLEGYDRLASMSWRMATINFTEDLLRREQLVNCAVHFLRRPAFKTSADYNSRAGFAFNALTQALRTGIRRGPDWARHSRRVLAGSGRLLKTRVAQLGHVLHPQTALALRVTLEHTPNPSSRVCLTDEQDQMGMPLIAVDWRVSDLERRSLDRFHELLTETFRKKGLGRIELRLEDDDTGWPSSLSGGKHHMGGTRMHADPRQGVVDPDCRVHGIDNLYIAGSSVFPTGGYANPTFTIIALAMRLSDHLRARLERRAC